MLFPWKSHNVYEGTHYAAKAAGAVQILLARAAIESHAKSSLTLFSLRPRFSCGQINLAMYGREMVARGRRQFAETPSLPFSFQ